MIPSTEMAMGRRNARQGGFDPTARCVTEDSDEKRQAL